MAFRRGGAGKQRDVNEASIIAALRAYGVRVWQVSGAGLPDLLCYYNRRWTPMEIKSARGRLTEVQAAAWMDHPFEIVRDEAQALRAVGVVLR